MGFITSVCEGSAPRRRAPPTATTRRPRRYGEMSGGEGARRRRGARSPPPTAAATTTGMCMGTPTSPIRPRPSSTAQARAPATTPTQAATPTSTSRRPRAPPDKGSPSTSARQPAPAPSKRARTASTPSPHVSSARTNLPRPTLRPASPSSRRPAAGRAGGQQAWSLAEARQTDVQIRRVRVGVPAGSGASLWAEAGASVRGDTRNRGRRPWLGAGERVRPALCRLHSFGERGRVVDAVVAATVDEEGGRSGHAALVCAGDVLGHALAILAAADLIH